MTDQKLDRDAKFQAFLAKARSLDLGPIAYQLIKSRSGPQWSKTKTTQAIARYLAFLYLIEQYPRLPLVPTAEIDQVWHQHILDTEKYAEDCQHLFGQFIHHFPYLGQQGTGDRQRWYRAYALTQVLWRKHFGELLTGSEQPADCEPLQAITGCRSLDAGVPLRPTISISLAANWPNLSLSPE